MICKTCCSCGKTSWGIGIAGRPLTVIMRRMRTGIILAAALIFAPTLESAPVKDGAVAADLAAEVQSIQPGEPFTAALRLRHDPGWHTYWRFSGTGYATRLKWDLPPGFKAGNIQWPVPEFYSRDFITDYVYHGEVLLLVEITTPEDLPAGRTATLKAKAEWLMCKEVCQPGEAELKLELPAKRAPPNKDPVWAPLIAEARRRLPQNLPEWSLSASRTAGRIGLEIKPAKNAQHKPANLYFFSSDGQVDPDAEQTVKETAGGYFMGLTVAETAPDADKLTGVLKSASGWRADGSVPGLKVSAPYQKTVSGPAAASERRGLGALLGLALLGGLILNLMPCVFPVLGIKIMGFVNQAREERSQVILHGLLFAFGVLLSFWVLAGALLLLRAGGEELGWGFQLQSPGFVFILAVILLVFALNLSGLFEAGLSAAGTGGKLTGKRGLTGSFFSGILATTVATPCSAPFLAPALGAALALRPAESFLLFTFIAMGLSAPYLTLSAFPGLVKFLPRPGGWMTALKQFMSFLLYASSAYLVWVLAAQIQEYAYLRALFALVAVALAGWIYGRWASPARKPKVRRFAAAAALVVFLAAMRLGYPVSHDKAIAWETWSPGRVADLRSEGRIIYVDFTARWCATCQANKAAVFTSAKVLEAFKKKNVAALKADWTRRDPRITEALARFGRAAVPLNLIYHPGRPNPLPLPEILTPGIVLDALEE